MFHLMWLPQQPFAAKLVFYHSHVSSSGSWSAIGPYLDGILPLHAKMLLYVSCN